MVTATKPGTSVHVIPTPNRLNCLYAGSCQNKATYIKTSTICHASQAATGVCYRTVPFTACRLRAGGVGQAAPWPGMPSSTTITCCTLCSLKPAVTSAFHKDRPRYARPAQNTANQHKLLVRHTPSNCCALQCCSQHRHMTGSSILCL